MSALSRDSVTKLYTLYTELSYVTGGISQHEAVIADYEAGVRVSEPETVWVYASCPAAKDAQVNARTPEERDLISYVVVTLLRGKIRDLLAKRDVLVAEIRSLGGEV